MKKEELQEIITTSIRKEFDDKVTGSYRKKDLIKSMMWLGFEKEALEMIEDALFEMEINQAEANELKKFKI